MSENSLSVLNCIEDAVYLGACIGAGLGGLNAIDREVNRSHACCSQNCEIKSDACFLRTFSRCAAEEAAILVRFSGCVAEGAAIGVCVTVLGMGYTAIKAAELVAKAAVVNTVALVALSNPVCSLGLYVWCYSPGF